MKFVPALDTQFYLGQTFIFKVIIEPEDGASETTTLQLNPGPAFSLAENAPNGKPVTKNGDNYEVAFSLYVNNMPSGFESGDLYIKFVWQNIRNKLQTTSYTKPIHDKVDGEITSVAQVLFTTDVDSKPSDPRKTIYANAKITVNGLPLPGYIVEWQTQTYGDTNFFLNIAKTYLSNDENAQPLTNKDLNPTGAIYQKQGVTVVRSVTDELGNAKIYMTANDTMGFAELVVSWAYPDNRSINEVCVIDPNTYPTIFKTPVVEGLLDGTLQLNSVTNPFTAYLEMPTTARSVDTVYAIVNGVQTTKSKVTNPAYITTKVYKKLISVADTNDFYYAVCDPLTGAIAMSQHLAFPAKGNPDQPPSDTDHDLPAPFVSSVINHNTIALNRSVPMIIQLAPAPINKKWTPMAGDEITASVFIQGFEPRTYIPKMTPFDLTPYPLTDKDIESGGYTAKFPAFLFYNYGIAASGALSTALFSYIVKQKNAPDPALTSDYKSSTVETVGPF